jgi:hypothetical protein
VDATVCDLAGIPRCVALRFDGERQP